MAKFKPLFLKLHFILLGMALLNFLLKKSIGISLNYQLAFGIHLVIYLSGLLLFFWHVKPFKKIAVYFSLYCLTPLVTLLFSIFGGVFLAIIASIFLYPVFPPKVQVKNKEVTVYEKTSGFMRPCCLWEVTQKEFLLLEKQILETNGNEEFSNPAINTDDQLTTITFNHSKFDHITKQYIEADTVIYISTD